MKAMYWILGAAILMVMLDRMIEQDSQGVCEPPQLSRVLR